MRKTNLKNTACFGLVLFLAGTTLAVEIADDKSSLGVEPTTDAQRERVSAEVKRLRNHPWAGEYCGGDGLGGNTTLTIAPESGFVLSWRGGLGLYDRTHGSVTWTNDRLRLCFAGDNRPKGYRGQVPELIPVAWGQRAYLVPADDFIGFCDQVYDGREPRDDRHGQYLLRRGDEKLAACGSPSVPKEFQRYLLVYPIEATIIEVGTSNTLSRPADWSGKAAFVVINAGTNQGLRAGMKLMVIEPAQHFETVEIAKVYAKVSGGFMTQEGNVPSRPKVGWRLSTRAPWRKATNK